MLLSVDARRATSSLLHDPDRRRQVAADENDAQIVECHGEDDAEVVLPRDLRSQLRQTAGRDGRSQDAVLGTEGQQGIGDGLLVAGRLV
jgi:hypothetical protein